MCKKKKLCPKSIFSQTSVNKKLTATRGWTILIESRFFFTFTLKASFQISYDVFLLIHSDFRAHYSIFLYKYNLILVSIKEEEGICAGNRIFLRNDREFCLFCNARFCWHFHNLSLCSVLVIEQSDIFMIER